MNQMSNIIPELSQSFKLCESCDNRYGLAKVLPSLLLLLQVQPSGRIPLPHELSQSFKLCESCINPTKRKK